MFLSNVRILNFRSIQYQVLTFNHRCRILVGINESGKSNVLRALSMLSPDVTPEKEDVREPSAEEGAVKESFVRFVFDLNNQEVSTIYEQTASRLLTKSKDPCVFDYKGEDQTLEQFCKDHANGLYRVNIIKGAKEWTYFSLEEGYRVKGRWKKISTSAAQADKFVRLDDDREEDLGEYLLIDTDSYPEIPGELLEDADAPYVYAAIGAEIIKVVKANMPACVSWTYKDENLLPSRINLASFVANPNTCLPLKNMFSLAGIAKVSEAINEAKLKSTHGLRNLLNMVAIKATKHIHSVWKEYRDIEIRLEPYGPNDIDAGIKDAHNLFEMSRRSDGFKRFVSFLLLVSAQVRTKELVNTLLLIDEPDSGLHPTGARYLRDELISIAGGNYVVFSTHSVFMIDKSQINRHLIVKKQSEVTSLLEADESNFVDEEVLYNALGFSIFEILAEKNILFEGWRDKKLFEVALSKVPSKHKVIKEVFKAIGKCHAHGVKDLKYITPLLELTNRSCIIISDDDEIAREKQKEFRRLKGYGAWLRYSEVLPSTHAVTGEDFVTIDAIKDVWNEMRGVDALLPDIDVEKFRNSKGVVHALSAILVKAGVPEGKKVIETFKDTLFEKLKTSHVDELYYEFLEALAKVIAGAKCDS